MSAGPQEAKNAPSRPTTGALMTRMDTGIGPRIIEEYAAAHSMAPPPLLDELEAHTEAHCASPHMLVGRLEGALLRVLVRLIGALCLQGPRLR